MTQPHFTDQLAAADKWLRERRLVTIHHNEVDALDLLNKRTSADVALDGVILVGAKVTEVARHLRLQHPHLTVLIEPHAFATAEATAESPFVVPRDGLFQMSLGDLVAQRLANGDTYVLTPTGYLTILEPGALKAVIAQANEVETDRLIVTLPLDSSWLKASWRQQLIAVASNSRHPLLISLGAEGDPLGTEEKADGLVTLLESVENVSFTRADHLVGLEALARTSGSIAFGTIPSRRRVTPPGKTGFSSDKTQRRPHVYYPTLDRFIRGNFARQLFANTPPPSCDDCCKGRALDEFRDTDEDHAAAMNHNVTALLKKASLLRGTPTERLDELASIYHDAEAEHVRWSGMIGREFSVPDDQRRLGQLSARRAIPRTSPR